VQVVTLGGYEKLKRLYIHQNVRVRMDNDAKRVNDRKNDCQYDIE